MSTILSPEQFERFKKVSHSFQMDDRQQAMDESIRAQFHIPDNRYYSVVMFPPSMQGRIIIDKNRTRVKENPKISKSNQSA